MRAASNVRDGLRERGRALVDRRQRRVGRRVVVRAGVRVACEEGEERLGELLGEVRDQPLARGLELDLEGRLGVLRLERARTREGER
jgi:hypothetical protein